MINATLTSTVDTFIRVAHPEKVWHDYVPLTVMKYLGEERQVVRQMALVVDRPAGFDMSDWKQTVLSIGTHVQAELSSDGNDPIRVFIGGRWCNVRTIQRYI